METKSTGQIFLPTLSACALWEHEITGQLSDGMWENAAPHDHWMFWCRLTLQFDPSKLASVVTENRYQCRKTGYNIAALYEHVGARMVNLGRLATAAAKLGMVSLSHDHRYAAEDMPATYEEFTQIRKGEKQVHELTKKHLDQVSEELAHAYYNTKYEMKHLRADVKLIKTAMKSVEKSLV